MTKLIGGDKTNKADEGKWRRRRKSNHKMGASFASAPIKNSKEFKSLKTDLFRKKDSIFLQKSIVHM